MKDFIIRQISNFIATRIVKWMFFSMLKAIGIASGPAGWIALFFIMMVKFQMLKEKLFGRK